MTKYFIYSFLTSIAFLMGLGGCVPTQIPSKSSSQVIPKNYSTSQDTSSIAKMNWREYFTDPNLIALIDTALKNNQELNITLQEIEISKNEIQARKGEYLPFVSLRGGLGFDKQGRYTRLGAVEHNLDIKPETKFPDPLPDFMVGAFASWELDVWKKLRNAKQAAIMRYLASIEGRNFMVTNLVGEIADSYFELMALDNLLEIIQQNIEVQSNALEIIKIQKEATKVTELAVRRFEAQLLNTKSLQFEVKQQIVEIENHINFLLGRFPQPIQRSSKGLVDLKPEQFVNAGIPSQLLTYRPDIRQAEMMLASAKLDVKVAKAQFYPIIGLIGGLGFQAYKPSLWLKSPESIIYSMTGELISPLINRNALKANYRSANARQIQAIYQYEQTVLNAYLEVSNQLNKLSNMEQSFQLKAEEVRMLNLSISISGSLFNSARADYMEVLMTQRDALEAKMDMIETKKQQLHAKVNIYRALGGGWK
jgi:NodT family efflux transporter outer membrane factor (OMF) lipoprotein